MRIRSLLLSAVVGAASLWPVAVAPAACAGEAPRAALVVDTGDTVLNLCVTLPDDSVSGLDLIKLASKQHGLSYKLGFGGAAVCHLAGVGPTGDDCFEDDPDFWGYWRANASGGWTWASTGAGSTTVTDGSVEGWAWGSGTGPATHPAPPVTRFADVCAPVSVDGSKGSRGSNQKPAEPQGSHPAPGPAPTPDGTSQGVDGPAEDGSRDKTKKRAKKKGRPKPAGTPAPVLTPSTAPTSSTAELGPSELVSDADGGGPPAAGLAALSATALLVGGGALAARRRRARS